MGLELRLGPALEARGLTLQDLSNRTPFDLPTLEAVERGEYRNYRITTLEALCNAIGCEVGGLFASKF